ncbi:MAG: GAF domain-containing sensor histidine kinase [Chloroflexi bacterium]|nr:GAF domain-containing sensor histidine kinase [Chloroflexota bacterium]
MIQDQTFTFQEMAELERRRLVAASLRSTLAVLNSNQPLEKLLNFIVNQACPLLDADGAAIYHLQMDGILTIQALVGLSKEYVKYANIPLGKLATGHAALSKKPIFIEDTHTLINDSNLQPDLIEALNFMSRDYRSILSVPIDIREESYGSLTLYYKQSHKLSDEDIALAKDFSVQAALVIDNARLRMQVQQDAVEEERNRLARELHDSVTQNLFSASLIAEALPKIMQRDPQKGYEGLNEIRLLTQGALAEMRSLLLELRPHSLEDVKLEDLLHQLTEAASGRLRKKVTLKIKGKTLLPIDVRLTFYRVAQEALNNIIKHAEANNITILLDIDVDEKEGFCKEAKLTIMDDGCGFIEGEDSSNHMGFSIMRERAQLIGAQLTIESRLNCGTTICLDWHP